MQSVKYFCDGSFNPLHKIAVIAWTGWDRVIHWDVLRDTTNTSAELEGLIKVLDSLSQVNDNCDVTIFTDCLSAINRISSREKLEETNFVTKKGTILGNADRYIKIFNLIDQIPNKIEFKHIKGHIPRHRMTDDNLIFSSVDKFARKQLREIIKDVHN
jgi:ribonuclease HI